MTLKIWKWKIWKQTWEARPNVWKIVKSWGTEYVKASKVFYIGSILNTLALVCLLYWGFGGEKEVTGVIVLLFLYISRVIIFQGRMRNEIKILSKELGSKGLGKVN